MKYRLQLSDGKVSQPYSKQDLLRLQAKGKIPDGADVLLATDVTAWLKAETEDKSGPATDRQKEYAESLGVSFDSDATKKTLSILIDAALSEQHEVEAERWGKENSLEEQKKIVLDEAIKDGILQLLSEASIDELVSQSTWLKDSPANCGAILLRYDLSEYEDASLWVNEDCPDDDLPSLESIRVNACDMTDGAMFHSFVRALALLMQSSE